jgi:hypothetical protein
MKSTNLKQDIIPDLQSLVELYNSAGWYIYTRDLDKLRCAFEHSLKVVTAWDGAAAKHTRPLPLHAPSVYCLQQVSDTGPVLTTCKLH